MSDTRKGFLADFFGADGSYPNSAAALSLFERAFVPAPSLSGLQQELVPEEGKKKVVIIDGHPRSGKTWSAVHAVGDFIASSRLAPEQYWTSGVDSLKVAPDENTELLSCLEASAEAVAQRRSVRLVFLDDILGANTIRPLRTSLLRKDRLLPFFRWDSNNPWLRAMPESSTLIITGRSLHITLMELLLDLNIRDARDAPEHDVVVRNPRRGLFRTCGKGDPFGTFDRDSLREVCRKNRQHHPFAASGEVDWLFVAAPLLAFDPDCQATERQKRYAARALFGDDLQCLVDLERELLQSDAELPAPGLALWRLEAQRRLDTTYLLMIAPGLVFLDPGAYEALGIEEDFARILVDSLYLYGSVGEFRSGRLPNELYMLAVDDHLRTFLGFAAAGFARQAHRLPRKDELKTSLGLRGLVERALHIGGFNSVQRLVEVSNLRELLASYLQGTSDPLLHLELHRQLVLDFPRHLLHPGLMAAVGWALSNFAKYLGADVLQAAITEWFPEQFRRLLADRPGVSEATETAAGSEAVAIYSTFLQWVLKVFDRLAEDPQRASMWVDRLLDIPSDCPEPLSGRLQMVSEDEILWASNEGYALPERASAILEALLAALLAGHPEDVPEAAGREANRFFTLSWHNEWMDNPEARAFETLHQWIDSRKAVLLRALSERPELIAQNLRYHWCHFVTQRAVWMRDWCFSDNPLEFERTYSQIARGSRLPTNNNSLEGIARTICSFGDADSVRSILFLVGTRASRMPELGGLIEVLRDTLEGMPEPGQRDLRLGILHAVFELGRQGFLDPVSEETTREFREWCFETIEESRSFLRLAWERYWHLLQRHTHLDVLPRQMEGWEDIGALRSFDNDRASPRGR